MATYDKQCINRLQKEYKALLKVNCGVLCLRGVRCLCSFPGEGLRPGTGQPSPGAGLSQRLASPARFRVADAGATTANLSG